MILVDDGLATGASMFAAVAALRHDDPARMRRQRAGRFADASVRALARKGGRSRGRDPNPFGGVGAWYEHFPQLSDERRLALLGRATARRR